MLISYATSAHTLAINNYIFLFTAIGSDLVTAASAATAEKEEPSLTCFLINYTIDFPFPL